MADRLAEPLSMEFVCDIYLDWRDHLIVHYI